MRFNTRRAGRHLDIVLISAERWRPDETGIARPAHYASHLRDCGVADLIIVTHKVAPQDLVTRVMESVRAAASDCARGVDASPAR